MLFALYVAGLGNALHNSKLGYQLGGVVLTALFFADDLVLIAGSPKWAMDRLLEIVAQFCKDMYMKLAVSKTFILTNSPNVVDWSVEDETIEEVLAAKYLGVNLQIRGRNMVGHWLRNVNHELDTGWARQSSDSQETMGIMCNPIDPVLC